MTTNLPDTIPPGKLLKVLADDERGVSCLVDVGKHVLYIVTAPDKHRIVKADKISHRQASAVIAAIA